MRGLQKLRILHAGAFTSKTSDRYYVAGYERAEIDGYAFDFRDAFLEGGLTAIFDHLIYGIVECGCNVVMIQKGELFTNSLIKEVKRYRPDVLFWLFFGDMRDNLPAHLCDLGQSIDAILINNKSSDIWRTLKKCGYGKVFYHHTAADDRVFNKKSNIKPEHDLAFFGSSYNVFPKSNFRRELLEALSRKFSLKVYGNNWGSQKFIHSAPVFGEDFSVCASKAKLTIGVNNYNDVPFYTSNRLWNSMACSTHVTHYFQDLDKVFENKKHLMWFKTIDECVEVCEFLLGEPELRQQIFIKGRDAIKANHTYEVRAKELIKIFANWNKE